MGDFEVLVNYLSSLLFGIIIYNIINCFLLKSLLKRFGALKASRRDFYECGFRPQTQRPVKLSVQFLLICAFFLLYDVEFTFMFPYVSGVLFEGLYDSSLIMIFFFIFMLGLIGDYERHVLYWQH